MSEQNNELFQFSILERDRKVKHTFSVKKEFFAKNNNLDEDSIKKEDIFTLMDKYKIANFFHNEKEPSFQVELTDTDDNPIKVVHQEFWINGNRVTDLAVIEKMKHDAKFADKVDKMING